jgi:hypothetical protein
LVIFAVRFREDRQNPVRMKIKILKKYQAKLIRSIKKINGDKAGI